MSTEIPDKDWTNPFPEGFPLRDLYARRVRNEQDLVIIIDDFHARRGTGKTVAALQLAEGMNQAGELTEANATTHPEQLRNAYVKLPNRSALVLDEGEVGASKYDAGSKTNKALRQIMSMGRIEEKYLIVTMPDKGMLDREVWKLSDVWISMVEKGRGIMHYLKRNPYASGDEMHTEKVGAIGFEDIETGTQLRDVYNHLTRQKKGHIRGDQADDFVPADVHREELADAQKEARTQMRNELIRDVWDSLGTMDDEDIQKVQRWDGITQTQLAEAVGLSQQQISKLVD